MLADWLIIIVFFAIGLAVGHHYLGNAWWAWLISIYGTGLIWGMWEKIIERRQMRRIRHWAMVREIRISRLKAAGSEMFVDGSRERWRSSRRYRLFEARRDGSEEERLIAVTSDPFGLRVLEVEEERRDEIIPPEELMSERQT